MKNQKSMGNKGFSLVELIVVIAIMVVLVGVFAPQFFKYVEKARISTDIQNLDQIKTAVEVYLADNSVKDGEVIKFNNQKGEVEKDYQPAMTNAGLDINVELKSSNWSDVEIAVEDGKVTVSGTATYNNVKYSAAGTSETSTVTGDGSDEANKNNGGGQG
jgi:prepilin-type N-terminal cleavage/methylation domain-containing protein